MMMMTNNDKINVKRVFKIIKIPKHLWFPDVVVVLLLIVLIFFII